MTRKNIYIAVAVMCAILLAAILLALAGLDKPSFMQDTEPVEKRLETAYADIPVETPILTPEPREIEVPDDVRHILLIGLDARYDEISRADSIILAAYNTTKNEVRMVSFMRDIWTDIPGRAWPNRLNTATVWGGPELLIETLNADFNLEIEDYIEIKFKNFKKIIDEIGGIDLELTGKEANYINYKMQSENKYYSDYIPCEAGVYHLTGAQALWHCRNRSVGDADYERTSRQQQVLRAIGDKVMSDFDLKTVTALISFAMEHVNTNLSAMDIMSLASSVLSEGMPEITGARVPFDGAGQGTMIGEASVIEVDFKANAELIEEFLTEDWTHMEKEE